MGFYKNNTNKTSIWEFELVSTSNCYSIDESLDSIAIDSAQRKNWTEFEFIDFSAKFYAKGIKSLQQEEVFFDLSKVGLNNYGQIEPKSQ